MILREGGVLRKKGAKDGGGGRGRRGVREKWRKRAIAIENQFIWCWDYSLIIENLLACHVLGPRFNP